MIYLMYAQLILFSLYKNPVRNVIFKAFQTGFLHFACQFFAFCATSYSCRSRNRRPYKSRPALRDNHRASERQANSGKIIMLGVLPSYITPSDRRSPRSNNSSGRIHHPSAREQLRQFRRVSLMSVKQTGR